MNSANETFAENRNYVKLTPEELERFWSYVNKQGSIPTHNPSLGSCWEWTGGCARGGYGQFSIRRRTVSAHRISWMIHRGEITPEKPFICHRCDNKLCVRDSHIWDGTPADNMSDKVAKGRQAKGEKMKQPHFGDANGSRIHIERMPRGEGHELSKWTGKQILEMRAKYAAKVHAKIIRAEYGISSSNFYGIIRRDTWKHI